jgi:hypothetical protein
VGIVFARGLSSAVVAGIGFDDDDHDMVHRAAGIGFDGDDLNWNSDETERMLALMAY